MDLEIFVSKLAKLIRNADLRRSVGQEARAKVTEDYLNNHFVQKHLELYREIFDLNKRLNSNRG
jgi:hypothetical protein